MAWIAVGFEVDAAHAEPVADALLHAGASSVEVADAAEGTEREQPLFGEPGAEPAMPWQRSRIAALFEPAADLQTRLADALAQAGVLALPEISIRQVADQDWVRATQSQFNPIQVSERLWIVPSWCDPPDPAAISLRLDPGVAFGTGAHATTWQCLRWLDAHLEPGCAVLDYGCGSGVLAIAAKRLGAGKVVGVDIDSGALAASAANAQANAVAVEVTSPDRVAAGPYDLVLANILARPLVLLAPLLANFTRPRGDLVLAGILSHQAAELCAVYSPWFDIAVVSERDGWACLAGRRKLP